MDTDLFNHHGISMTEHGWSILPLEPGGKKPATVHGVKDACDDPAQIVDWSEQYPGCNVGIACGPISGLFVIDLDGPGAVNTVRKEYPELLLSRTVMVKTPRGFHLYFRHFDGAKNIVAKLGKGIDTRSENGYVVAPPSKLQSGVEYTWLRHPAVVQIEALPEAVRERWDERCSSRAAPDLYYAPVRHHANDENRVRAALKAIPANCNRELWVTIGFALNDHFGPGGLRIWDDWSRTAPDKYDPHAIKSAWRSMRPGRGVGIAKLYSIAKDHGVNLPELFREVDGR